MKRRLLGLMICYSISCFALEDPLLNLPMRLSDKKSPNFLLQKTNRIQVEPLEKMNLPNKGQLIGQIQEQKEKGYYLTSSPDAKNLLTMSKKNPAIGRQMVGDTQLQKNIQDIPLLFEFQYLSQDTSRTIGYAPTGMWKDQGWTGVIVYFIDTNLGTCSFSLQNIALSNGGAKIPKEVARYDVNKKITTVNVKGSPLTGFSYRIGWFDEIFIHNLKCSKKIYDDQLVDQMIIWAKEHDQ